MRKIRKRFHDERWLNIGFVSAIFLILLLSNLTIITNSFGRESAYKCDDNMDDGKLLLRHESITQNFYLNDPVQTIGVYLAGEGTKATIIIEQNEYKESFPVIIDSRNYYYISPSNMSAGFFTLSVTNDTNDDIFVFLTKDLTLGSITDRSEIGIKSSIITQYNLPYSYGKIILLMVSMIIGMIACWIIISGKKTGSVFWLTAIIIALQIILKYTATVLSGEAYYEVPGVYLGNIFLDGWNGLLQDDAGYLPILLRIISILIIKVFHLTQFAPLIYALISVVVISLILSFITLNQFNSKMSLRARFIVSIILGCSQLLLVHSQMIFFINMAYFGSILLLFIYWLGEDSENMWLWMILSGLLVASKGTFLILIPVLFVPLLLSYKGKKKKLFRYTLYLEGILFLQLFYVLFGPGEESAAAMNHLSEFVRIISKSILVYLYTTMKWLFRINENSDIITLLFFSSLFHVFVIALGAFFIWRRNSNGIILIGLQCTAFFQILLNELGAQRSSRFLNTDSLMLQDMTKVPAYEYEKNVFLVPVLYIIVILFFMEIVKNYHSIQIICLMLLAISGLCVKPQEQYEVASQGNWTAYSKQISNDSFAIPNNNYTLSPKFLKRNCKILYYGNESVSLKDFRGLSGVDESIRIENGMLRQHKYVLNDLKGSVNAVYASKSFISQTDNIYCLFLDDRGNEIGRIKATPNKNKISGIAFLADNALPKVKEIQFVTDTGDRIDLYMGIYVVCTD